MFELPDDLVTPGPRLPAEPASASRARRWVREALRAAGREDCVDAAELGVSELVTNATLHARTPVELSVAVGAGEVRVQVRDFNPVLPVQRHYGRQASTGRGMALVASLSHSCGVDPLPDGKVAWFVLHAGGVQTSEEDLLAAWDEERWDVPADAAGAAVAPREPVGRVRLLGVPPALWLAARRHHDALLRELALYLAVPADDGRDGAGVDLAGAELARETFSNAIIAAIDDAQRSPGSRRTLLDRPGDRLAQAPAPLDLHLELPLRAGAAAAALQDALDTAERLAAQGDLLAFPGQPEVVAVRDWVCDQVQSQLLDVAPRPWPGAAQERFETAEHPHRGGGHDLAAQLGSLVDGPEGVVAADEGARIVAVSRALAAALGWRTADLVGRRIVTLIPARLREAHVVGFSRHLGTGESRIIGEELTLPVLHADGREIACGFRLEQRPVPGGRSLYLAWIEPPGAGGDRG